jgi:hypothetical protein
MSSPDVMGSPPLPSSWTRVVLMVVGWSNLLVRCRWVNLTLDELIGTLYASGVATLRLFPDAGGWVHADWDSGHCWVRFTADTEGTLVLSEVHSTDPDHLRGIPIGRIRAACSMRGAGDIVVAIATRLNDPIDAATLSTRPEGGATIAERFILTRPPGKALAGDFYQDVAHAYESCVVLGLPPNKTIAADLRVATTTVAAWVAESRRRGHIDPGVQGRAGAVVTVTAGVAGVGVVASPADARASPPPPNADHLGDGGP